MGLRKPANQHTSGISDVCPECGVAPQSVEQLFNCQVTDATHSPVGQPGHDCRLPQAGQLTIREELLGYHNNNNSDNNKVKHKIYVKKTVRFIETL